MEPHEYDTMALLEDRYWWYLRLRRLVCHALRSELGRDGSPKVLDAGCGTGGSMGALAKAFPGSVVIGTDIESRAIDHCVRRHPGRVVQGSVTQLPFQDGTFDAVVSLDVLYIKGVDHHGALEEARRVLRPGGWLVVNVPAFQWLQGTHDVAVHTRQRYRRSELQQLLTTHGFTVRRLMYWNALLLPIVFLVRRFLRRGGRSGMVRSDLRPLPRSLNWSLMTLTAVDTWLCRAFRVPFGTSIFGMVYKGAPQ